MHPWLGVNGDRAILAGPSSDQLTRRPFGELAMFPSQEAQTEDALRGAGASLCGPHRGSRAGRFREGPSTACGHTGLLTTEFVTPRGLEPYVKVLSLKDRVRCRGCGIRGGQSSRWSRRRRQRESNGAWW